MIDAPKDGTTIVGIYADGSEDLIRWESKNRHCVLGPRAGAYPPGWVSTEADGLPVDPPETWRPHD